MRSNLFLLLASSVALSACSTLGIPTPQTPRQAIYALDAGYIAAEGIALQYKNLPLCGHPTSPTLCSDANTVASIKQADNVAYNALLAATNTAENTTASDSDIQVALIGAQNAVSAFTAITANLKVK